MKEYRFNVGDKVRIRAKKSSSNGVKEHDGEIVTIKARCVFTWAYELEEFEGFWTDGCFDPIPLEMASKMLEFEHKKMKDIILIVGQKETKRFKIRRAKNRDGSFRDDFRVLIDHPAFGYYDKPMSAIVGRGDRIFPTEEEALRIIFISVNANIEAGLADAYLIEEL